MCVLLADRTVQCWGCYLATVAGTQNSAPVTVSGITNAIAVTVLKTARVELIYDGLFPPGGVGSCFRLIVTVSIAGTLQENHRGEKAKNRKH